MIAPKISESHRDGSEEAQGWLPSRRSSPPLDVRRRLWTCGATSAHSSVISVVVKLVIGYIRGSSSEKLVLID